MTSPANVVLFSKHVVIRLKLRLFARFFLIFYLYMGECVCITMCVYVCLRNFPFSFSFVQVLPYYSLSLSHSPSLFLTLSLSVYIYDWYFPSLSNTIILSFNSTPLLPYKGQLFFTEQLSFVTISKKDSAEWQFCFRFEIRSGIRIPIRTRSINCHCSNLYANSVLFVLFLYPLPSFLERKRGKQG